MLGFPLLYFKGMRLMMFQLSSFYCRVLLRVKESESRILASGACFRV